jgi:hypothetical protein
MPNLSRQNTLWQDALLRGPAEGVGLLPTIGKTLKINERFGRYVLQDYRTSVPLDEGEFFVRTELGFPKRAQGK